MTQRVSFSFGLLLLPVATLCAGAPIGKPKIMALPLGDDVKMEFVWIAPGVHDIPAQRMPWATNSIAVQITKGFWLGRYEVTQRQYETVTGANPSRFVNPSNPVEHISWVMASAFARELSLRHATNGWSFRLPTEMEWEFACGNKPNAPFEDKNSKKTGPAPVGKSGKNQQEIYGQLGNVFEWCADWYDRDYLAKLPVSDPQGPGQGIYRVLKGGSWSSARGTCTVELRNRALPENHDSTTGFRLVTEPINASTNKSASPVAPTERMADDKD